MPPGGRSAEAGGIFEADVGDRRNGFRDELGEGIETAGLGLAEAAGFGRDLRMPSSN
jgi:hypothetical protein